MAVKKRIILEVDAEGGIKQVDELKTGVQETSKAAEKSESSFKKMKSGIGAVGLAWKAIGIGAVISALTFLADKLSANQEVLDKVAMASAVFGDVLVRLAKPIIEVIKGIGMLGKAMVKVFKGDFKGASEIAVDAFGNVKEAIVGNSTSLKDFIKNAKDAAKETVRFAKELVRLRNEVKLAEANQRQLQLVYQKDAELQRQIRDDISLTFEERIAANTKLGEILNEQFAEEEALALKKVRLAELELSRNKGNIDLQVALIDAKTELADLDERITGQRSEQLTNLKALEEEQADFIEKQKEEAEKDRLAKAARIEQERVAAEERLALEKQAAELGLEFDKSISDARLKILVDEGKKELAITQAKIDADKALRIGAAKDILGSVAQLAGEGTKTAKAAALAGILIDTAKGVSGAIAAGAGLTFPLNLGAIATGVASVLAGIANAKAVLKKVGGGGGGGGDTSVSVPTDGGAAGGLGGESLLPNMEAVDQPTLGATQPTQAFVVESDISNAQALQQELDLQSTL